MLAHSDGPSQWTPAQFSAAVQEVLNHLYDAAYLRKHPLVDLLIPPETDPLHRSQETRRILIESIGALRPSGAPAQSSAWRAYRILELRYLEGLSPRQIMDELAVGRSHFYREHLRILEALTELLWERVRDRLAPGPAVGHEDRATLAHREVERLCAQAEWAEINLADVVEDLRSLAETLAAANGTTLALGPIHDLVLPRADWTLARQALLGALTYGLSRISAGHMTLASVSSPDAVGVCIQTTSGRTEESLPPRQGIGLQVCEGFVKAMGGWVEMESAAPSTWTLRLLWPIVRPGRASLPVLLVIDDNEEFLDLYRRYLSGHPWQVVGAADGDSARRLAHALHPTVSLLDVMLPKEDGWEILRRFKAEPATQNLPVIICSVLNEPQVAAALGAAGYLLKPVTQRSLLQALAPWRPGHAMPMPTIQA